MESLLNRIFIFILIAGSFFSKSAIAKELPPLNLELPKQDHFFVNLRTAKSGLMRDIEVFNNEVNYGDDFYDRSYGDNFARTIKILGFNSDTALAFSGVQDKFREYDHACYETHIRGDVGNQWCHAYFSKLAHSITKELGYNELVAQGVGISVFLIKEFFDKNYNFGDISTAPMPAYNNESSKSYVTVFLDGAFYFEYAYTFN